MGAEMARRGFFAELNYQAQQAEKQRRQQAAAAYRAQAAAEREAERAYKAAERAQAAAGRASAAEQKAAQKHAADLHFQSRTAEVASMNADLTNTYGEIDGLLAWTLEVDDYVDLQSLKIDTVNHPAFDPGELAGRCLPCRSWSTPSSRCSRSLGPEGAVGPGWQEAPRGGGGPGEDRVRPGVRRMACAATAMHADYLAEQARRAQAQQDRLVKLAEAQARYEEDALSVRPTPRRATSSSPSSSTVWPSMWSPRSRTTWGLCCRTRSTRTCSGVPRPLLRPGHT